MEGANNITKAIPGQQSADVAPKVCLAFRCNADLKLRLSKAATQRGLTLSEYCEMLLENWGKERLYSAGKQETEQLTNQVEQLTRKLNAYEEPLKRMFTENKNQTFNYPLPDGQQKEITIRSVYDVHILLTNSFKSEP